MPSSPVDYSKIVVQGAPEDLEQVVLSLFDAGCLGVEEKDVATIEAYFPSSVELAGLADSLSRLHPRLVFGPIDSIPDQDWLAVWKSDFHAFSIGKHFYIVPSWETPPRTKRHLIRIDPERAFGTGTHETTGLSIELIEDVAQLGSSVIDAGTGTGVLAMVSAALGCRPVLAIENDPEAASCARTNILRNGFGDAICLLAGSLMEADPEPADLVVANLSEAILRDALPRLSSWVRPDGKIILSGILRDQVTPVVRKLPPHLGLVEQRAKGDWAALLIAFKAHA